MNATVFCNKTGINDEEFMDGLRKGIERLTRKFFYEELKGLLSHIQFDMFGGRIEYDELVNELYLFLAADGWKKLDSFEGKNGCHLKTWMSPVAWRFFMSNYDGLMERNSSEGDLEKGDSDSRLDKSIEIAIDVNAVLEQMPNRKYAEALELLLQKGYTADEVATMWNTNAVNVYNIKHRAIQQFIEWYRE